MRLPRTTWHVWLTWLLLLAVCLVVIALALTHDRWHPSSAPTAGYCPTLSNAPSGCIYGLTNVQTVVHSAFAYEAGLLDYEPPIDDIDYLLGYGVQQKVRLPGGHWRTYRYLGAIYVAGSGWVLRFLTPSSQGSHHFAFLHIAAVYVGGPAVKAPPLPPQDGKRKLSGDERTALAAIAAIPKLPVQGGTFGRNGSTLGIPVRGGTVVGLSGWPSDPAYGNGSSGAINAHLCSLVSAGALNWFWKVAGGYDHKPKPPVHWQKFGKHPHKSHGRLTWPARVWLHHQKLGAYTGSTWTHRKGSLGFSTYRFEHGHATCWPKRHRCHVVRSRTHA